MTVHIRMLCFEQRLLSASKTIKPGLSYSFFAECLVWVTFTLFLHLTLACIRADQCGCVLV